MKKKTNEQPKIGLALAGGGLQGFAHIGVIKALEELNIEIEYVSGTSTGSIMASFYAMGYNSYEVKKICERYYKQLLKVKKSLFLKLAFNYWFHKETRIPGIINGDKISNFINKSAKEKNIDLISDIKKRKLAIATVDTITMKECIFVSNKLENKDQNINYITDINIGKAVHSSMAFPGIFTTLDFKQYNFIDGGTVDNLPSKVLRDMGAQKIIAISFDLNNYKPSKNLEGIIVRALDIFSSSDVRMGQKIADIAIEISNPDTSLLTIGDLDKTIENGYNAVMKNKEKINELILGRE